MKRHKIESELVKKGVELICGLDEAGRGPLAGPVVGAAVILNRNVQLPGLNDSKLLEKEEREELFEIITKKAAYGFGVVDAWEIDKIGILQATQKAFYLALKDMLETAKTRPEYLLIDGRDAFFFDIPYISIVKGDTQVRCIAAASIVAKVVRDGIMWEQEKTYPQYSFRRHKGYGTQAHYEELAKYGDCPIHRKSFNLVQK